MSNVFINRKGIMAVSGFDNGLKTLLNKAKSGEEPAFTAIYNQFFEKIYRFVFFRVSHKETAEDITEDVFIKAFSSLTSLSEDAAFEGWLYQIARNKIIDHYRSRKKTLDISEFENTLEYDSNIVDSINLDFDQKALLKAIEQLKPDEQQIIKLRFFEDLDTETSAQILKKSAGAVRVLQHRSIAKLKIILEARTNEQN